MLKKLNFNKPLNLVLIIYAAILLITVVISLIFGPKLSIDFKGGTSVVYSYSFDEANGVADVDAENIKATASEIFGSTIKVTKGSSMVGNTNTVTVDITENKAVTAENQDKLLEKLTQTYPKNNIAVYDSKSVSPTLATSFFLKSITAIVVAGALVVVYVGFRFRKIGGVTAALTAFAALFIDMFISFSACVIFRLEIDTTYMAVLLLILGYSLNDTIVVYDSVRENKKYFPEISNEELVDKSLNTVFARNIVTTCTTLVAVVTIIIVAEIFGLKTLRPFAIPMAFGLVSGCISSLFVAAPLWVRWRKALDKKKG